MKIYNSYTRKKEEFKPIEEGKIRMYACGPTVYNYFHIGNARTFMFFDVVKRYFEFIGYDVNYVQNLTDIDDKIIAQAIEEDVESSKVAEKYISAFNEDRAKLGIDTPTHQPKATKYIKEMIRFIKELVDNGFAYEQNGDVYFSVDSFRGYGSLSGRKVEDLIAGARVAENTAKKNPADFTLWKAAKPGEPEWGSPWGKGRPGWHTECVVMSKDLLGVPFDIHGGGTDLLFPHHENENAQAKALYHSELAKVWMHVGFLNIDGEKMSKSLKNFFLAREVLEKYDSETVRFYFLSKHYRSPIDYNADILAESEKAVANFYDALSMIDLKEVRELKVDDRMSRYEEEFNAAMQDDFNTAKAIAVLFELSKTVKNFSVEESERKMAASLLLKLGGSLGFFQNPEEKLKSGESSEELISLLIKCRNAFKKEKMWEYSDMIRDDLKALGIVLMDTPDGTKWTMK